MVDFTLYLITDRMQARAADLPGVIEPALKAGVKAVQLREKDLSGRALYELACAMRRLTSRYGAKLLINDRPDIALAVEADGVHLGEQSMPVTAARKVLGGEKLIGVSCHNHTGALAAQQAGADFITFGPVYHTPSKARYGDPVGIAAMTESAKLLHIPVYALGGIKKENAPAAINGGAYGIALISAIIAADDPGREAEEFLEILRSAKAEI